MSEHLSEAEVADIESRVRYYREIGKVERDFCATIGETDRLLAERRALREALEFYAAWTKLGSRNPSTIIDDAGDRARRALLAPQKEAK